MTIGSWLLWPLTFSCAAAASGRSFEASPEAVRDAVRVCLKEYSDVREEPARFVTGWGPERTDLVPQPQGFILGNEYRYRVRHTVTVDGPAVQVASSVERRAPGGPRSLRWERVDPVRAETLLLDAIARRVEGNP